ncbi:MAG: ATP-binding cassette domain-containing protein [Ignavibacteria bacterium]|nr:ATP-binding cassette domain-containing protein [Ignavibacteria bacterium]
MLNISGITVTYDTHEVLKDFSLRAEEGKVYGLMGLNGSGKTTLLKAICGVVPLEAGSIQFQNREITLKDIGYLETANNFYSKITGSEFLNIIKWKHPDFDIEKWNSIFELPLNDLIETYSSGMRKKLAAMGIFGLERPLLLLDEPFNNLDLETNTILYNVINLLKKSGRIIILTSHILETLTGICDEIHYLNDKKIERIFFPDDYEEIQKSIIDKKLQSKIETVKQIIK